MIITICQIHHNVTVTGNCLQGSIPGKSADFEFGFRYVYRPLIVRVNKVDKVISGCTKVGVKR